MSPIKRLIIKEKRDEGNKFRVERHKLTMQPSLPKKKKKGMNGLAYLGL